MPFQTQVNAQPSPAVEGDFASANPRASMLAGDSRLTAGVGGVIVGRFARAKISDGTVTNADPGVPARTGFLARASAVGVLITAWLASSTMTIQQGIEVTLFDAGDFWGRFAGGATVGQKVFASYADGSLSSAPAGSTVSGAAFTADTNGTTTLNVTATSSGTIVVGQPVTGTDIPAGAYIASLGTGTGGVGTYILNTAATGSHTGSSMTSAGAEETNFYVHSTAAAGELAKISHRPVI